MDTTICKLKHQSLNGSVIVLEHIQCKSFYRYLKTVIEVISLMSLGSSFQGKNN